MAGADQAAKKQLEQSSLLSNEAAEDAKFRLIVMKCQQV
jgi:hypothetical protein